MSFLLNIRSIPMVNIFNYPTISTLTIMLKGDFDKESLDSQIDEELAQRIVC